MEQSTPWEANSRSAGKEICHLYGSLSFSTLFIRVRHWIMSVFSWIHSTNSELSFLRSLLILFFHLKCWFEDEICCATCPIQLIFLYFIALLIFCEDYKLWWSLMCNFFCHFISYLLGPNILLRTFLLNTLPLKSEKLHFKPIPNLSHESVIKYLTLF
jgi:hypothetical protein